MLAREYADAAKIDKPVILSHHMLMGLGGQVYNDLCYEFLK